ncbi:hypothetical protein VTH82DRAFT_3282 [Thermothelomyces myriococcoides]
MANLLADFLAFLEPHQGTKRWIVLAISLGIVLPASSIIYNVFFHPLRSVPGPKSWAATPFPYVLAWLSGSLHLTIHELHEKYGDVVRVAPNRLSFTHPDAWNAIRGHRKSGKGEHGKESIFYLVASRNILGSSRAEHSRFRRILSHGFSAKSMQEQQPLIRHYVDLLMQRLKEKTHDENGKPHAAVADLAAWFNFTTFDVIGDLSFGEPFGCLEQSRYHAWVRAIFETVGQIGTVMALQWAIPPLFVILSNLSLNGRFFGPAFRRNHQYARDKIAKRLSLETSRPDFVEAMATAKSDDGSMLDMGDIVSNARLLVTAGSETTATALSGAAYFLARYPEIQARLAKEVRESFTSEDEIDLFSVNKLQYMLAFLDEAMRMFPPVPSQLPRQCHPAGDVICGYYVPGGTSLDIWPWAMNYSSRNFTAPDKFLPERWLDETGPMGLRFDKSRQGAFQPFSVGPRNCIGKNLAYVEMRLILARLIWNYDLAFADEETPENFLKCKAYTLWMKGPLNIRLIPVRP